MTKIENKRLDEIYMHTSSGKKYYPFAPKPQDVDINVIAHHLATRARWNGATQHTMYPERIFYSVAEHSVYVALWIEHVATNDQIAEFGCSHDNHEVTFTRQELALMGLLHDGSESYNGDLIRPLKYSREFSEPFGKVETLNEVAVAGRFKIPAHLPRIVKIADNAVCAAESQQIVPKDPTEDWQSDIRHDEEIVAPFKIEMLPPYQAKRLFMHHYERLAMTRVAA